MSWKKKCAASYYQIECSDPKYLEGLENSILSLQNIDNANGLFESGDSSYMWKLFDTEMITDTKTFYIGIAKERIPWPVWFREDGTFSDLPISEGFIGEVTYAFINPGRGFAIIFTGGSGGGSSVLKKFLSLFSVEEKVLLNPILEQEVVEKVKDWDLYKSFKLSLKMPSMDRVTDLMYTDMGKYFSLMDELGGLKLDISVNLGTEKGTLVQHRLHDFIDEMIESDFCGKLSIAGANFTKEKSEEIDLKNAKISYKEDLEVDGYFVDPTQAKQFLIRSFLEHKNLLIPS